MTAQIRFVVIGDSFTEGVGDDLPDGSARGWADLAAQAWANSRAEAIEYANLAIRGKLAKAIVDEQLEPALALGPTHLAFNGGGNDVLRPGVGMESIASIFAELVDRCVAEGVRPILLSGPNPSRGLPLRRLVQSRGDALSAAVVARIGQRHEVIQALNWPDRILAQADFWAEDRLHLGPRGHHRVAARVVTALGERPPAEWWDLPEPAARRLGAVAYYWRHVAPWVARRVQRRSSGDGRTAKYPEFITVEPTTPTSPDESAASTLDGPH